MTTYPLVIPIGIPLLYTAFFAVTGLPKWLNFKPFNCIVCLSFWTIIAIHVGGMVYLPILKLGYLISLGGIAAYVASVSRRLLFRI